MAVPVYQSDMKALRKFLNTKDQGKINEEGIIDLGSSWNFEYVKDASKLPDTNKELDKPIMYF